MPQLNQLTWNTLYQADKSVERPIRPTSKLTFPWHFESCQCFHLVQCPGGLQLFSMSQEVIGNASAFGAPPRSGAHSLSKQGAWRLPGEEKKGRNFGKPLSKMCHVKCFVVMSTRNAEWWLWTTVTKSSDFPFLLDLPIMLPYFCQGSKGKPGSQTVCLCWEVESWETADSGCFEASSGVAVGRVDPLVQRRERKWCGLSLCGWRRCLEAWKEESDGSMGLSPLPTAVMFRGHGWRYS